MHMTEKTWPLNLSMLLSVDKVLNKLNTKTENLFAMQYYRLLRIFGKFSLCLFACLFLLTLRNKKNIPKIIVGSLSLVAMEA